MGEVKAELLAALERAPAAGVPRAHTLVDPGIGFSKDAAHSLETLRRLPELAALDRPLLVGPSRKSFIGRVLDLPVERRLLGTAGAVAACVMLGRARGARPRRARDGRGGAGLRRDPRRRRAEGRVIAERLAAFFSGTEFGWWDLLDILIVAFLVYELLRFLRGTHAVQIALGGVVLVLLYWASILFNLQTVNWLLRTFLPFLVFGIIVVFQAEIRKGLAHLGRAPFLGGAARRRQEEVVDEIVLAATRLASEHTGAIVALEREMGLRSYIETGIALDAVVTYDLLVSIFHPATPLHDGAVVIQGNRVAAAACFLPLTVHPELSRTLGSRHRAAIGLSEDTDAVAIVVSEETGTISLVEGGRIRRGLDGPALQAGACWRRSGSARPRGRAAAAGRRPRPSGEALGSRHRAAAREPRARGGAVVRDRRAARRRSAAWRSRSSCGTCRATSSSRATPSTPSTCGCAPRPASSTASRPASCSPRSTSPAPPRASASCSSRPQHVQVPFGFRVVKITPSLLTLNLERTRAQVRSRCARA